jgi:phosphoglucomutase/phosphomannomutase
MTTHFEPLANENALRDQLSTVSSDTSVVDGAIALLREWFANPLYAALRPSISTHVAADRYALLLDSFYQFVPFGTGGRRGRVGYGPNRINDITVALSVQGHCDYLESLNSGNAKPSVVVAYDVRVFNDIAGTYTFLGTTHPLLGISSRALARLACGIYAANGITAYLPPADAFLSTPELSFLIRHFGAAGGVNISASHNHPDDNGFKFYTAEGAQDIPPRDEVIAGFMNRVTSVRSMPFDDAVQKGLVQELGANSHNAYLAMNLALRTKSSVPDYPIVYTPLCGTGDSTVGDVLRAAGYKLSLFEPQTCSDGTFATIPSRLPNPEIARSAHPAVEYAKEIGSDLIFSTDPDADRLGVIARTAAGDWRHMTGNEIASCIAYYLILDHKRGPSRKGLLIKSLVTTRLIEEIARAGECTIIPDLLVGFKYIAHVLNSLDRDGHYVDYKGSSADLLLAAEESHGVLLTPHLRDKDAAGGALLLAELSCALRDEGMALPDYYDAFALSYGNYANAAESLVMRGIEGTQTLNAMMKSLRDDPPSEIGEFGASEMIDFLREDVRGPLLGETDRAARNLLVLRLHGAVVTIRPSGTEPKGKIYVDLEGRALGAPDDRDESLKLARRLAGDVASLCLARVGIHLAPSAKRLPDFVDIDLKQKFSKDFAADLLNAAEDLSHKSADERRQWLRDRLVVFGAGADPLDATADAVVFLCDELAAERPALASALGTVSAAARFSPPLRASA